MANYDYENFNKDLIVGIDLDGVIRNFNHQHNLIYERERISIEKYKHLKEIPANFEPPKYSFKDNEEYSKELLEYVWENFQTEMFKFAPIYEGAEFFVKYVFNLFPSAVFITHQYTVEAKKATQDWLRKHGFIESTIFEEGDKKWRHIDILVDDKISNLEKCIENGKKAFCIGRPWNTSWDSKTRGDFSSCLYHLKEIALENN